MPSLSFTPPAPQWPAALTLFMHKSVQGGSSMHGTLDTQARLDTGRKRAPLYLAALALTIGVALWLRFRNLAVIPLWLDEGYSAYGAEQSFDFIFRVLPGYETHPPFYTALLKCWTLIAGNSVLAFRLSSAVAGTLALPVFYFAGREAGRAAGRDPALTGLAALALTAVSPGIVEPTHLVRPYALMALILAAGVWAVLRVARGLRDEEKLPPLAFCAYLCCQAALFWVHNLGSLYVAGLGLALLLLCGPVRLMRGFPAAFFGGHAIAALAGLPALLILLDQAPTWADTTWLRFSPRTALGDLLPIFGLPGIAGLICAALIARSALPEGRRVMAALAIAALTPVLLSLILSLALTPVFLPRTLLATGAPVLILIAIGAPHATLVPRAALALMLVLMLQRVLIVQALPPPENWRGATAWLKARIQPGDRIYAYPNEGALPLHYAMRERDMAPPVRPIPEAVPAHDPTGRYVTGSRGVVSLPRYRLEQIASDPTSRATRTIWLIRLGASTYDRGDEFLKALRRDRRVIASFRQEPISIIGLTQRR
jgi:mannosyltransferase